MVKDSGANHICNRFQYLNLLLKKVNIERDISLSITFLILVYVQIAIINMSVASHKFKLVQNYILF